jgi:excisionase family DNA binding protein
LTASDGFMTVADAAAMLRRSERTIRRLIADGRLPAQRAGRAYRIRRSDVDRLIADELVASSAPPPDISPLPASLREQLFSPREVADLLNQTDETVRRWLEYGALSGFKGADGEWIVRRVDLIPWARPLLESEALDALERPTDGPGVDAVQDLIAMEDFVSSRLAAQDFERRARIQPLFHYTSADTALDAILANGSLRLSPPAGVNDPFESGALWPSYSILDEARREEFDTTAMRALTDEINGLLRDRCRLACLSRSGLWDWGGPIGFGDGYVRARMWAQYGDLHAGVCLAFDQDRLRTSFTATFGSRAEITAYAAPVRYRSDREPSRGLQFRWPEITEDVEGSIDFLFPAMVADLYFTKAWDWSTETEYRFLVRGRVGDHEYLDITDSLTGIFLGPRFPQHRLPDLKARCRPVWDAGRVYQIKWREWMPVALPVAGLQVGNWPGWRVPDPPVDLDTQSLPPPDANPPPAEPASS